MEVLRHLYRRSLNQYRKITEEMGYPRDPPFHRPAERRLSSPGGQLAAIGQFTQRRANPTAAGDARSAGAGWTTEWPLLCAIAPCLNRSRPGPSPGRPSPALTPPQPLLPPRCNRRLTERTRQRGEASGRRLRGACRTTTTTRHLDAGAITQAMRTGGNGRLRPKQKHRCVRLARECCHSACLPLANHSPDFDAVLPHYHPTAFQHKADAGRGCDRRQWAQELSVPDVPTEVHAPAGLLTAQAVSRTGAGCRRCHRVGDRDRDRSRSRRGAITPTSTRQTHETGKLPVIPKYGHTQSPHPPPCDTCPRPQRRIV